MKKMKITIHKDGTQKVEALQCTGEDCILFTQQMENRLGTPLGPRELKPEYHETESETERQREVDR